MSVTSASPVANLRAAYPYRWVALAVLATLQFMLILDAAYEAEPEPLAS
jgi:hypothetical protein